MRFFAALLCSTALLAQAKSDPLRYVPKDADVVARTVGPAAWQRDFAPTSLGKALTDPQLLPIWTKLVALVESEAMLTGGEQDLEQAGEVWGALKDYSGEIVFAARADWDAMEDLDDMRGAGVVAMGPDGKCDLGKIAELLGDKLPGEKSGEMEVGGVPATIRENGSMQLVGPVMHDGHLVLLFGNDLEAHASWFFGDAADKESTSELREPTFALSLRCKHVLEALAVAAELDGMPSWMFEQLGVMAIKEFTFSMIPDGKFVRQELQLKYTDGARGLMGVFCPVGSAQPDLLRLLPAGASTYAAAPMDMAALLKVYEDVFANHSDDLPMDREGLESLFSDMTNLDLVDDLLAHIGGEYMRIDDMVAQLALDDEDDDEQVLKAKEKVGEACFVIKLTNGRAFAKNLDIAIRSRGLHVGRKREEYNETKIYRMNLLGMFPIEYAVTDSLFVLGIGEGEGTKKNLRSVLDAAAAADGEAAPAFAPDVTQRLAGMRAGWGGIQVGSLVEILEGVIATGETVDGLLSEQGLSFDDMDDPWQLMMDGSKALQSVLTRHKAGVVVNLDYFEKDRYVMRSRW